MPPTCPPSPSLSAHTPPLSPKMEHFDRAALVSQLTSFCNSGLITLDKEPNNNNTMNSNTEELVTNEAIQQSLFDQAKQKRLKH